MILIKTLRSKLVIVKITFIFYIPNKFIENFVVEIVYILIVEVLWISIRKLEWISVLKKCHIFTTIPSPGYVRHESLQPLIIFHASKLSYNLSSHSFQINGTKRVQNTSSILDIFNIPSSLIIPSRHEQSPPQERRTKPAICEDNFLSYLAKHKHLLLRIHNQS